ncbi:MAG: hypothetical protein WCC57_11235 [Paracoccaceae bacterium]
MLVLSWRALEAFTEDHRTAFEDNYFWENSIIRLWLYRTAVKMLTRLPVESGKNGLKAIHDMIEHFDDDAAGVGRGPASRDRFERGRFVIERATVYDAAIRLRSDAQSVSDKCIAW